MGSCTEVTKVSAPLRKSTDYAATNIRTTGLSASGKALTGAVIKTQLPANDLRNASLRPLMLTAFI
jgi:hypothetical protein